MSEAQEDHSKGFESIWSGCFEEFCRETTLAGFNYLLKDYGPLVRRLMWGLTLTVFTGITIYQLSAQINSYIQNPLKISQSRSFPPTMEFPTVSVCNTMLYRVSAVRPVSEMHDALSDMYATPTLNLDAAKYHISSLSKIKNVSQYINQLAPQKTDLILNCSFADKLNLCNIDRDFSRHLTSFGVCYEFNSNRNREKPLTISSSTQGLELILNAETYEAMPGPYSTFGVNLFVFPFGKPDYMMPISPLVDTLSQVTITQEEVHFMSGYTCDSHLLKYFPHYTRTNCKSEIGLDSVIETCGCIPHEIMEGRKPTHLNLTDCDLGQYYVCVVPTLGAHQHVSESICPKECSEYVYAPMISQAEVSWDRIKSYNQFNRTYFGKKVRSANEISQRYNRKYNHSAAERFEMILNACREVTEIFEVVNLELKCDGLEMTAEIPKSTFLNPSTVTRIFKDLNSLKANINSSIENFNGDLVLLSSVANNQSLLNLFGLKNVSLQFEKLLGNSDIISVNDGDVYFSFINTWVKTVTGFIFDDENNYELLTKLIDSFSWSGDTVLLSNETNLVQDWRRNLQSLDVKSSNNCWSINSSRQHSDYHTVDRDHRTEVYKNKNDKSVQLGRSYYNFFLDVSVLDVMSCLLIEQAEPNLLHSISSDLVKTITILKKTDLNAGNIKRKCQQFLCAQSELNSDENCMNQTSWQSLFKYTTSLLIDTFDDCRGQVSRLEPQIDLFINIVKNNIVPDVNLQRNNIVGFIDIVTKIQNVLTAKVWPNVTFFPDIPGSIDQYLSHELTYSELSRFAKLTVAPYVNHNFNLNQDHAVQILNGLLTDSKTLSSKLVQIENIINANGSSRRPFAKILLDKLLKSSNETSAQNNLRTIGLCMDQLRNITDDVFSRLPGVRKRFVLAVTDWEQDANDYLHSETINKNFLKKNFLVVRIMFSQMSITVIQQTIAYDFWSLMSDIGGASGLWLGFSVVFVVQCVDLIIRRCCIGLVKTIHKKRLKASSRLSSANGPINSKGNPSSIV